MSRIIFVTGTDTAVGKTVVTTMLTDHLHRLGVMVRPLKLFSSGGREDAELMREAVDRRWTLDQINPYAFTEPLTPLLAAELEGRRIDLQECLQTIRQAASDCELLLVEGAGGLMSPLGEGYDALTLIRQLDAPSLLVTRDRLGVINQVVTTLTAMERKHCSPLAVVMNRCEPVDDSTAYNLELLLRLKPGLICEALPQLSPDQLSRGGFERVEKKLKKTLAVVMGHS